MEIIDTPMYGARTISQLVHANPQRVRRWLQGYRYTYKLPDGKVRRAEKKPVVDSATMAEEGYASFLDLIDLLFVNAFVLHGHSLQKIRRALEEAKMVLNTTHFARQDFFTTGKRLYVQLKDKTDGAEHLLELLSGGQWVIAPIIKHIATQIIFHRDTGLAERWYPRNRQGLIVVDPRRSYGQPTLVDRRTTTIAVYDMFLAEGKRIQRVCDWFDIKPEEVSAAVRFEKSLVA